MSEIGRNNTQNEDDPLMNMKTSVSLRIIQSIKANHGQNKIKKGDQSLQQDISMPYPPESQIIMFIDYICPDLRIYETQDVKNFNQLRKIFDLLKNHVIELDENGLSGNDDKMAGEESRNIIVDSKDMSKNEAVESVDKRKQSTSQNRNLNILQNTILNTSLSLQTQMQPKATKIRKSIQCYSQEQLRQKLAQLFPQHSEAFCKLSYQDLLQVFDQSIGENILQSQQQLLKVTNNSDTMIHESIKSGFKTNLSNDNPISITKSQIYQESQEEDLIVPKKAVHPFAQMTQPSNIQTLFKLQTLSNNTNKKQFLEPQKTKTQKQRTSALTKLPPKSRGQRKGRRPWKNISLLPSGGNDYINEQKSFTGQQQQKTKQQPKAPPLSITSQQEQSKIAIRLPSSFPQQDEEAKCEGTTVKLPRKRYKADDRLVLMGEGIIPSPSQGSRKRMSTRLRGGAVGIGKQIVEESNGQENKSDFAYGDFVQVNPSSQGVSYKVVLDVKQRNCKKQKSSVKQQYKHAQKLQNLIKARDTISGHKQIYHAHGQYKSRNCCSSINVSSVSSVGKRSKFSVKRSIMGYEYNKKIPRMEIGKKVKENDAHENNHESNGHNQKVVQQPQRQSKSETIFIPYINQSEQHLTMAEIKQILIKKLPHLRAVIMSLSDQQLGLMYSNVEGKQHNIKSQKVIQAISTSTIQEKKIVEKLIVNNQQGSKKEQEDEESEERGKNSTEEISKSDKKPITLIKPEQVKIAQSNNSNHQSKTKQPSLTVIQKSLQQISRIKSIMMKRMPWMQQEIIQMSNQQIKQLYENCRNEFHWKNSRADSKKISEKEQRTIIDHSTNANRFNTNNYHQLPNNRTVKHQQQQPTANCNPQSINSQPLSIQSSNKNRKKSNTKTFIIIHQVFSDEEDQIDGEVVFGSQPRKRAKIDFRSGRQQLPFQQQQESSQCWCDCCVKRKQRRSSIENMLQHIHTMIPALNLTQSSPSTLFTKLSKQPSHQRHLD